MGSTRTRSNDFSIKPAPMQECVGGTEKVLQSARLAQAFACITSLQARHCRAPSGNDPGGRGVASFRRPYEECSRARAKDAKYGSADSASPASRSIWRLPRRDIGD